MNSMTWMMCLEGNRYALHEIYTIDLCCLFIAHCWLAFFFLFFLKGGWGGGVTDEGIQGWVCVGGLGGNEMGRGMDRETDEKTTTNGRQGKRRTEKTWRTKTGRETDRETQTPKTGERERDGREDGHWQTGETDEERDGLRKPDDKDTERRQIGKTDRKTEKAGQRDREQTETDEKDRHKKSINGRSSYSYNPFWLAKWNTLLYKSRRKTGQTDKNVVHYLPTKKNAHRNDIVFHWWRQYLWKRFLSYKIQKRIKRHIYIHRSLKINAQQRTVQPTVAFFATYASRMICIVTLPTFLQSLQSSHIQDIVFVLFCFNLQNSKTKFNYFPKPLTMADRFPIASRWWR